MILFLRAKTVADINLEVSPKVKLDHRVVVKTVNTVERSHQKGNCLAYGKKCRKETHFKSLCKSGSGNKHGHSKPRFKDKGKTIIL